MADSIFDFTMQAADGSERTMDEFRGDVMLIVNVASKCGLTPQYEGLEKLYEDHKGAGFTVLGFPSNQFGNQEPGSNDEIQQFCSMNYGVSFPVFAKVDVNGKNAHPLWKYLKDEKGGMLGDAIKWNFTKFLVDRDGTVVKRFAPTDKPEDLEKDILAVLAQ